MQRRQAAMESNFTYAQQTVNNASRWTLEFTWPRMTHAEAEVIRAWLDSLKGQVGTFRYRPRNSVTSTLTGKMLRQPAYSYNSTIEVQGWADNAASQLRIGQHFQLGEQLFVITNAPANADGEGVCVIEIEPQLRVTYATGTDLNFRTPSGKFRLATSDGYGFTLDPDKRPDFGVISAREAVE